MLSLQQNFKNRQRCVTVALVLRIDYGLFTALSQYKLITQDDRLSILRYTISCTYFLITLGKYRINDFF